MPFSDTTLTNAGVSLNWPHPQLLRLKGLTLLADATRIFQVDESNWSLTEIQPVDLQLGTPATIPLGGFWHVVDFWDTWMLTNGLCTVLHYGRAKMFGGVDEVYIDQQVRYNTATDAFGRAWFGGFSQAWSDAWKAFWDDWMSRGQTNLPGLQMGDLGKNWVMWSSIGGGDVLLLLDQTVGMSGLIDNDLYSDDYPRVFDLLRSNQLGFMPMPWQGAVLALKPLGRAVMVYGEGGVSALLPQGHIVGLREFSDLTTGVYSGSAVGGTDTEHVFMDKTGALWRISPDLQLQRLDYREWTYDMLGREVVISINPVEREFYICDGTRTLVLTPGGLTETTQVVTSIVASQGTVWAFTPAMTDRELLVETGSIVIRPGLKTVRNIEVRADVPSGTSMFVGAEYRNSQTGAFGTTRDIPVNRQGIGFVGVTSDEIRVKVKASDFKDVLLQDLSVRLQFPDRRYVRGTLVEATR